MKVKNILGRYGIYIFLSAFIAVYFDLILEMRHQFLTDQRVGLLAGDIGGKLLVKLLLFFVVALIVFLLFEKFKHIFIYIDRFRFVIGALIIIGCTLFELSGSSIGMYDVFFGKAHTTTSELMSSGTLFGVPRRIRGDEFAVLTPMNFSQDYNDFKSVSDIIRGTATDVTTLYAAPSFSLATLFRPFLWGYMLLGNTMGLAFYWTSRTVVLFLVSYEFGKLLTNKKKVLSCAYGVLITFSQTIQWWYSTNGLLEMFIFGQLALVLIYYLVRVDKTWLKVVIALGIAYSAMGYLLAYYPAQQIPLAYIFGVLAIYVIVDSRKLFKKLDVLLLIASVVVFAIVGALVVYHSLDTFKAAMGTVYPGARVDTGGESSIKDLFFYIASIFTPIDDVNLVPADSNVCDSAVFFSLFPLGIICAIYSMIKKRKADLLYILLIVVEGILLTFCLVGFPEIIAKITLLSHSLSMRIMEIVGFIDILLIIRFLGEDNKCSKIITASRVEKIAIVIICIIAISGLSVNPLQREAKAVYDNKMVDSVGALVHANPNAVWMVVSDNYVINNVPIMVGARTINSTNTYPNLELWEKIDEGGAHNDIYNRYAHILMNVTNANTSFELVEKDPPDMVIINVNRSDLSKLGVNFILSDKNLDAYNLLKIDTVEGYTIYKVT